MGSPTLQSRRLPGRSHLKVYPGLCNRLQRWLPHVTGKLTPAVGTMPHHTDLSEGWLNDVKIWQWASTRVSDKREQGGVCYFYNDLASKHTFGHALQVTQVKFIQWVSGGRWLWAIVEAGYCRLPRTSWGAESFLQDGTRELSLQLCWQAV